MPNGDNYIELMLYDKMPSEANTGVLNHISLQVDNVEVAKKTLSGRTLPKACKATTPIKTGVNKKRQINCFDIDGTRVEIMEANTTDGLPAPWSNAAPLKFVPDPIKQ